MQWITDNWIWLALGGGMLAMHLFGHRKGGHGQGQAKGRGCCAGHQSETKADPESPAKTRQNPAANSDS